IGMPMPREAGRLGHAAARCEKRHKIPKMSSKGGAFTASDPDIEIAALPHAPSVAFEIAAEEQFGRVRCDVAFAFVEGELHLAGHDGRCGVGAPVLQLTGDGAEVSAGAYAD